MQSAAEFLAGNFFGLDVVAARTDRLAVRLGGAVGPLGDELTFGGTFDAALTLDDQFKTSFVFEPRDTPRQGKRNKRK